MSRNNHNPADFIVPLNINGLEGRMLNMPSKKKNAPNILFIYGQHSSLERWMGIAEELSKLGNVVMPDLPGLGGMDSLYHIGQPATIDNMADYLATFIKLKYKGKKVIVIGMSLGFVVVTRMLQKYPELSKKVLMLVSIVGFAHKDDFGFTHRRLLFYRIAARIFSRKWPARLFRLTALNPMVISYVYHRTRHAKEKFENISGDEFKRTMDTEIKLWHDNDIRTQFKNYREMFHLDNTKIKIPLPVYHVAAKKDRYFDNTRVEEHMRQVFTDFTVFYTQAPNHAPTIIATAKEAAPFIPPALRKQIAKTKVK
jgi:pimeloyl-ACP methyl ester carboxylesterase